MRNDIMEKHEMMSLEDSGQLRDKMRFFEQELLKNHHIDPNLYVEYLSLIHISEPTRH